MTDNDKKPASEPKTTQGKENKPADPWVVFTKSKDQPNKKD